MACGYSCIKEPSLSECSGWLWSSRHWRQPECSSLIDVKLLVVHMQRGDNCPLFMCIWDWEVGKSSGATSFLNELFFKVFFSLKTGVSYMTLLWMWASIKNGSSAWETCGIAVSCLEWSSNGILFQYLQTLGKWSLWVGGPNWRQPALRLMILSVAF